MWPGQTLGNKYTSLQDQYKLRGLCWGMPIDLAFAHVSHFTVLLSCITCFSAYLIKAL